MKKIIYTPNQNLQSVFRCKAAVTKKIYSNDTYINELLLEDSESVIYITGSDLNIGSYIDICLGEDSYRICEYIRTTEDSCKYWTITKDLIPYSDKIWRWMTIGFETVILSLIVSQLFHVSIPILIITFLLVLGVGYIWMMHNRILITNMFKVQSKVIDMDARYENNQLVGYILLESKHFQYKVQIHEVESFDGDTLQFKSGWRLQLDDIISPIIFWKFYIPLYEEI